MEERKATEKFAVFGTFDPDKARALKEGFEKDGIPVKMLFRGIEVSPGTPIEKGAKFTLMIPESDMRRASGRNIFNVLTEKSVPNGNIANKSVLYRAIIFSIVIFLILPVVFSAVLSSHKASGFNGFITVAIFILIIISNLAKKKKNKFKI
jgi:hypothetical protein